MGLLPLEFTDCLTDSPYFRENLHAHEKELEKTSIAIKVLIKEVKDLVNAARGERMPNPFRPYQNAHHDCLVHIISHSLHRGCETIGFPAR